MEYYSAVKRNRVGSLIETWMDLEPVTKNEARKRKISVYQHIYGGSKNLVQKNLFAGWNRDADTGNKCMNPKGGMN